MGEQPLFSIVMPTFGVEPYIDQALCDLEAQTCADWELIVIDDHCTDHSAGIARRHASTDDRIRIVCHPENKGLSAARNTGISQARGRYLWIPDPDDRYEPDLLEQVARALEENPAQVTLFGVTEEYYGDDGEHLYDNVIVPPRLRLTSAEELRPRVIDLERDTLYGYAWNKVYSREYLADLGVAFRDIALIEDITFNVTVFDHITTLNTIDSAPYHYAKRTRGSLTGRYVPDYFSLHHRRIDMLLTQQDNWGTLDERTRSILGALYARYILSALERNHDERSGMSGKDRLDWCRKLYTDRLFEELVPYARAESGALKVSVAILRRRSPRLGCLLGSIIHLVRGSDTSLFGKLKQGR